MYMHIGGSGSIEKLAPALRALLDKIKAIRTREATPARQFPCGRVSERNAITPSALDRILKVKGESNSGMYKATIGRAAAMHGRQVGKQRGVNTWAAFAGTDESASVAGDFAMLESELQGVLKALRKANINIVAIHNHMTQEEPRYVFLHYWGKGRSTDFAKGLRPALDTQTR